MIWNCDGRGLDLYLGWVAFGGNAVIVYHQGMTKDGKSLLSVLSI